ncbi:CYB2, partial [Symbiodinium necroappetens]
VGKHNSKTDCWVVVDGQVLDVTSFLSEHPGGELAILTFAGKDATEEFNMIHPPDVIGKYAPDSIIGK